MKSEKSDTRLRSKGHIPSKAVFHLFVLVWFYLVLFVQFCLILFLEKEWERNSRQKEHKNILSEVPGAVLNLSFSLRHKDMSDIVV